MIDLQVRGLREIAVLGAHCDDIAIGMGGTLLTIAERSPGLRVRALVLTGGGTSRADEERAALASFCPGADVDVRVLGLPDGRLPADWAAAKDAVAAFRADCDPQVVFAPQRADAHQDHRLLAELVPTEFRDHLVLGYEIVKWETDLPRPGLLHPVDEELARRKARLLRHHYRSQRERDWFDDETFLGLSRLRGVNARARHAEGFVLEKAVLRFGGD